jgi:diadenosine tetraphosphate (Ap4A) HIT family hydrolase
MSEADVEELGDIPSFKLFESDRVLAFLDIQPLSQGHAVSGFCFILIGSENAEI